MDDIYKSAEEYNPNKKRKILIVFLDMIADMLSNKKLNLVVNESCNWMTQSYFAVPKNIRLNSSHCLNLMNFLKRRDRMPYEERKIYLINFLEKGLPNFII